jgi:hypothetical protein
VAVLQSCRSSPLLWGAREPFAPLTGSSASSSLDERGRFPFPGDSGMVTAACAQVLLSSGWSWFWCPAGLACFVSSSSMTRPKLLLFLGPPCVAALWQVWCAFSGEVTKCSARSPVGSGSSSQPSSRERASIVSRCDALQSRAREQGSLRW